MIQMCRGCGSPILVDKILNLTVRCDPTPLTAAGDIVRLLTSPNPPSLWMVEWNQQGQPARLRGARPGEAGPVREHRCTPAYGAGTPPVVAADPKAPRSPSDRLVAPSTPSLGPWTDHSSVSPAVQPRSSHPCDSCRQAVELDEPELYVAATLGASLVSTRHAVCTPA